MTSFSPEILEKILSRPRPDAETVAPEVNIIGKNVIVTGGASGIGAETCRVLAARGGHVILAVRDVTRGEEVAQQIRESTGNQSVVVMELDLASLASVRRFIEAFRQQYDRLHYLIANAGIMASPFSKTAEGMESQFGTNHLGHFVLVNGLIDLMHRSAPARVVVLSSVAHRRSPLLFDDVNFERTPYDPWVAYGQSKTANALFALELNRRHAAHGVTAFSVHPGGIKTGLQKHITTEEMVALGWQDVDGNPNPVFKTVAQGAATTIYAALSPELEGKGGEYLEDCGIAPPAGEIPLIGVYPHACDPDLAKKLWDLSEALLEKTI